MADLVSQTVIDKAHLHHVFKTRRIKTHIAGSVVLGH